jgi:BirA family biotin operon repressor/biotin-[acetyl-CoA-carboxylase] ligase
MLNTLEATILQQRLTTKAFGRPLYIVPQTGSTNDDVKTLAQQGAPEGTVVLAERQNRGRGRQGRSFTSPAGVGIYLSLLVRPRCSPAQLPQLTLLVAVATAEAILKVCTVPIGLKWPNDVEVAGKKVAGILTEALWSPDGNLAVIIGIGINVNTTLTQLPPALQQRVTSLALATGSSVSRRQLIVHLLAQLEHFYEVYQHAGLPPILEHWQRYDQMAGRRVRYTMTSTHQEGVVSGLDVDGALLVQTADGTLQRVIAGEVVFL